MVDDELKGLIFESIENQKMLLSEHNNLLESDRILSEHTHEVFKYAQRLEKVIAELTSRIINLETKTNINPMF